MKVEQMYPHRIRLRGPWEVTTWGHSEPPTRVQMPCRGEDLPEAVGYEFTRRFGSPSNLDDGERIWLTWRGLSGPASAIFNDHALGDFAKDGEVELTSLLSVRNSLRLHWIESPTFGSLWDEIAMEIRREAYLAEIIAWIHPDGNLAIEGEVRGRTAMPLEVYGIVAGQHAYYEAISPGSSPCRFSFLANWPGEGEVRVELVQTATVWYSAVVEPSRAIH